MAQDTQQVDPWDPNYQGPEGDAAPLAPNWSPQPQAPAWSTIQLGGGSPQAPALQFDPITGKAPTTGTVSNGYMQLDPNDPSKLALNANGSPWTATGPGTAGPPVVGPPGGTGSTGFGGGVLGAWDGTYTPPDPKSLQQLPNAPVFNAPSYTPPPAWGYQSFAGPSMDEALNDPGWKLRLDQGSRALGNWFSARGLSGSSDTGKALTDYNQNASSAEYQNVWNRDYGAWQGNRQNSLDQYNTNYKTQFYDPYTFSYQAAKDAFAPQMVQYSTQAANIQHQNDMTQQNGWNDYYLKFQDFENRRKDALGFAEATG